MGTKGRDVLVWLYLLLIISSTIANLNNLTTVGKPLFYTGVVIGVPLLWFHTYTISVARKKSKKSGFELVILLPVFNWWAKILTGKRLYATAQRTFEVHLRTDVDVKSLGQYFASLNKDLDKLANMKSMTGTLFIWESHMPVPSRFRKLIKQKSLTKSAFYVKGGWGIPYPPFVSPYLRKNKGKIYKGAFFLN